MYEVDVGVRVRASLCLYRQAKTSLTMIKYIHLLTILICCAFVGCVCVCVCLCSSTFYTKNIFDECRIKLTLKDMNVFHPTFHVGELNCLLLWEFMSEDFIFSPANAIFISIDIVTTLFIGSGWIGMRKTKTHQYACLHQLEILAFYFCRTRLWCFICLEFNAFAKGMFSKSYRNLCVRVCACVCVGQTNTTNLTQPYNKISNANSTIANSN